MSRAGWGGDAMVWANIIRSALVTLVFCLAADRREWLEPCRLTRARTRDLMRFALPMSVGAVAHMAARWWDNLLFGLLYNTQTVGLYNMAYNLADVPATTVGENIGDVLLPSYAHLDLEQRKSALVRSTALLALLMFPLAVGLGAVAHTAVLAFHFKGAWLGVAPMLSILSALSGVPIGQNFAVHGDIGLFKTRDEFGISCA